jgi:hypothetical protein
MIQIGGRSFSSDIKAKKNRALAPEEALFFLSHPFMRQALVGFKSLLGQCGDNVGRDRFAPADGINAFVRFRFEVNFLC